jgi:hypothetical protein
MTSSEIKEGDAKDLSGIRKDNLPEQLEVEDFVTNVEVISSGDR